MATAHMPRVRGDAPVARFVLPVSGLEVALAQPTGAEQVLLAERRPEDPSLALALAERLARTPAATRWEDLTIADVDTLIARLRQAVVGDRVIAESACAAAGCGERVDLSFSVGEWLAHQRPRSLVKGRGWRVERDGDRTGWFQLRTEDGECDGFRLPTLADQIAVHGDADPVGALAARCIHPARTGRRRARIEAAMAKLAPPLATPLSGECPRCGAAIAAMFLARQYCLRELCDRARFVFDDLDVLAERYHWSERAILSLPLSRRTQYVERARQALMA